MPQRLEDCLPIPSLAQELREMRAERDASEPPKVRIIVQRLTFTGPTVLTPSERRLILASLTKRVFTDGDYWLDEFVERIRDQWQHRGYFKVVVKDPVVRTIAQRPPEKRVAITVQVDTGPKYRLGAIDFRNGTQFPPMELRLLLLLRR